MLTAEITQEVNKIKEYVDQINAQHYKLLPRMVLVEIVLSFTVQIHKDNNVSRFNAQLTPIFQIKDNA